MDNTFELKRGKLVFEQDKIVITDDAKRQKRARILSALFLLVMGAYEIYRFTQKSEDQFLRSGLMVIGVGLILIVLALEEHEDVQNVYANFDIPDDMLKE